jgi:hypothetical protein
MFIRILREYERGVVFRLGRLLDPPKGPGVGRRPAGRSQAASNKGVTRANPP